MNCVIENTDELLARHNIRANFLNMGVAKIIQDLRKKNSNDSELMDELDDFDQELRDDYEQLLENVNTANADEIFDLFEVAVDT